MLLLSICSMYFLPCWASHTVSLKDNSRARADFRNSRFPARIWCGTAQGPASVPGLSMLPSPARGLWGAPGLLSLILQGTGGQCPGKHHSMQVAPTCCRQLWINKKNVSRSHLQVSRKLFLLDYLLSAAFGFACMTGWIKCLLSGPLSTGSLALVGQRAVDRAAHTKRSRHEQEAVGQLPWLQPAETWLHLPITGGKGISRICLCLTHSISHPCRGTHSLLLVLEGATGITTALHVEAWRQVEGTAFSIYTKSKGLMLYSSAPWPLLFSMLRNTGQGSLGSKLLH